MLMAEILFVQWPGPMLMTTPNLMYRGVQKTILYQIHRVLDLYQVPKFLSIYNYVNRGTICRVTSNYIENLRRDVSLICV